MGDARYRARVPHRFDRRTFIGAGLAVPAAVYLASCGGDDSSGFSSDDVIVKRFADTVLVTGSVRMPISFLNSNTLIQGPDSVTASVLDSDGNTVVEDITTERVQLDGGAPPFWVVRADVAAPGFYQLAVRGIKEPVNFQVFDPSEVDVPTAGDPLPAFDTPTVADPRGVNPICSRAEGVCPLHEITLTEALATGKPVAYLVGTPAHCKFGVCGPVLDVLLAAHDEYGDRVAMVHADVYADEGGTQVAPAVEAVALTFEPSLFIADATGNVVDRLDFAYDLAELREVFARAGV